MTSRSTVHNAKLNEKPLSVNMMARFKILFYYSGDINKGGTVSRNPRKHFAPAKPFLINPYIKTERCVRLKLLV